jgi:hypothetical protein
MMRFRGPQVDTPALSEETRQRAFVNRALRTFGPTRGEIAGGWKILLNEEHHYLNRLPNVIRVLHQGAEIPTGHGLDDWMVGVRFPAGAGNFSLRHRVQTGSGAHPTSYRMGTGGSFPGGKAAEA